ncbi:hypothetical protein NDU88_005411 [Pleurodeles waltl]|uniref:Secreted protein n=1 Tax=Pleurodeles waltl TaxID=8319 RepID=A0AAV7MWN0_PLEWA|nr:hypothetical protein NDU88_005411 [Pleurodeles waltl]
MILRFAICNLLNCVAVAVSQIAIRCITTTHIRFESSPFLLSMCAEQSSMRMMVVVRHMVNGSILPWTNINVDDTAVKQMTERGG